VGFTAGGEITAGQTSGTTGETYKAVTGMGDLPNMARLDTGVTSSVRSNNHLILVGGPAVNQLVADLASNGKTWTQDEWMNQHQGEALLQVVNDAFTQDKHALVVAGHSADDTRAAARYIAEYGQHQQALKDAGKQMTLTQADYPAEK
ncbi:MAG: S-layer protein, partial [Candidatus Nanohaloarchaea archaeon]|nr:S-layer protein [Candidatus Nanohaloarchaea archaeon]